MVSENTAGNMIREINDELEKSANNLLRGAGLTLSQIGLLLHLEDAPGGMCTVTELAKKLHIAQPTATGLVSRLEKKGLVCITADPGDGRIRNVALTEKGQQCCRDGAMHMKSTEERLLSSLEGEEREEFLRLLMKVRDGLVK